MHWILIAVGVILYAYLTFIKPHQAKSAKRSFDAKVEDVEQEEETRRDDEHDQDDTADEQAVGIAAVPAHRQGRH